MVPMAPRLRGSTRVVAESEAMRVVLRRIARFAKSNAPVAVFGETGTGKEIVARVLHANSSRARGPFVPVNVAALPAELLESELFGHGKGAFTGAVQARRGLFEAAHHGTLFLDEVAELPMPLQAKMLRALQDGEIRRVGETEAFVSDVRIVCATHRDLFERVREGSFREDLYYRLKVLSVTLPPLRERREDILPLARRLLIEEDVRADDFTAAASAALLQYAWPGNVRELHNAIRHGAALTEGAHIDVEDLPDELHRASAARPMHALCTLADAEREHILRVLDACKGSQVEAAQVLGIGRNTLWRKLREYGNG